MPKDIKLTQNNLATQLVSQYDHSLQKMKQKFEKQESILKNIEEEHNELEKRCSKEIQEVKKAQEELKEKAKKLQRKMEKEKGKKLSALEEELQDSIEETSTDMSMLMRKIRKMENEIHKIDDEKERDRQLRRLHESLSTETKEMLEKTPNAFHATASNAFMSPFGNAKIMLLQ